MIEIMPETEGNVLVVKATEKLTAGDYEEAFIPKINQLIEEYGKVRVVVLLAENFSGWEIGAAWDDAVFGIKHRNDFEKMAVVGGSKWVQWATKISAHFMNGQAAVYDIPDFQSAVAWVKE